MSSNLCWEPIQPKEHKTLSDTTKFFLREVFEFADLTDGQGVTLGAKDVSYLRGASVATKSLELKADIKTLLDAIDKYGEVRVWEQY